MFWIFEDNTQNGNGYVLGIAENVNDAYGIFHLPAS